MHQIDTELSLDFSIDQQCGYKIATALYGTTNVRALTVKELSKNFEMFFWGPIIPPMIYG